MDGELLVVSVRPFHLNSGATRFLGTHRALTTALGGIFTMLDDQEGVAYALVKYAREQHITQNVVGESSRSRLEASLCGATIAILLRETRNVDVSAISRD